MADNLTLQTTTATPPAGTVVSTDDAGASGHVQRVKLTYSADGSATHVQADADGVLVNLGSNNDVTVTGTVTANAGTGTFVVGDGGGSLTVDGTVTADAGTGPWPVTDNGGSLTVDGTVAATQSGGWTVTANAGTGTFTVGDGGSTISVDDGGGALTVDGTVAVSGTVTVDSELPTAGALADNTANPTVPAVGAFGMVWDGSTWDRQPGTSADGTLVNLGSNNDVTVTSGTVTIGSALPAGTNNIGDVDVLSVVPGTGATNLGKTEDVGHSSGDVGVMALAVRNDSGTSLSGTDLDYTAIAVNASGHVIMTGNEAHDSADSGRPHKIGGYASTATPSAVSADGDRVNAWFDRNGRLNVADGGTTLSVDDGAGSLTVDGTVAATQSGTWSVTDGGGSLTVDGTVTANAGSGPWPVTDNGGSLTVDGSVTVSATNLDVRDLARTSDAVACALQTDAMMNGATELTPKFAAISASASGDNTVLSAVVGKKIRVLQVVLVAAGAVTVRFESGAGGTALTGQMALAANGGFTLPFSPVGWFETASNTLLNLELSAAVGVAGCLTYVEV